jgi:hypothetical protein
MSTSLSKIEQFALKQTQIEGNSFLNQEGLFIGYPSLCKLLLDTKNRDPLTLDELEMLEAELQNQNIIPTLDDSHITLSQSAAATINLMRWKAQRYGINPANFNFRINLQEFIISAAQLTLNNQKLSPTLPTDSEFIDYLECFAEYLIAEHHTSASFPNMTSFQKGMHLVIKILNRSNIPSTLQSTREIVLPISRNRFLEELRKVKG